MERQTKLDPGVVGHLSLLFYIYNIASSHWLTDKIAFVVCLVFVLLYIFLEIRTVAGNALAISFHF